MSLRSSLTQRLRSRPIWSNRTSSSDPHLDVQRLLCTLRLRDRGSMLRPPRSFQESLFRPPLVRKFSSIFFRLLCMCFVLFFIVHFNFSCHFSPGHVGARIGRLNFSCRSVFLKGSFFFYTESFTVAQDLFHARRAAERGFDARAFRFRI